MKTTSKTVIAGLQVLEKECIWMKAGIINFKICDSAYDCNHCAFDKAMRRAMESDKERGTGEIAPEWVNHLQKKYRGAEKPCRHSLTGRVEAPKKCALNYECYHCEYDQMLDDIDEYQLLHQARTTIAGGFNLACDYYYHLGHSWARIEHGGRGRIGLDDFAVSLFGPCGHVDLPPLGGKVIQGRVGWTFRRENKEAAVLSPITGTVTAVNFSVQAHPEIMHADPYHEGWLFMVEPARPQRDLKNLYFGDQSRRWMEMASQQLLGMIGPEYEQLAATGGRIVRDLVGAHDELQWEALARIFLRTEPL
jgi:glycine cleavage system H lipoate-binding protein